MDGRVEQLKQKLDRLMREAAEVSVTLDGAEGTIAGVPHYTLIEARAHELGRQLSCTIQERQMAEVVARQAPVWMRGCWHGDVAQIIAELRHWQSRLGIPPTGAPDNDPRTIVAKTLTYLENNRQRMDYPEYRKQGLTVTTAWMESLVKEMNYRVKGTEMFWNNPDGAEAIHQVRAAALGDDHRLVKHIRSRRGCSLTRRPKPPTSSPTTAQKL